MARKPGDILFYFSSEGVGEIDFIKQRKSFNGVGLRFALTAPIRNVTELKFFRLKRWKVGLSPINIWCNWSTNYQSKWEGHPESFGLLMLKTVWYERITSQCLTDFGVCWVNKWYAWETSMTRLKDLSESHTLIIWSSILVTATRIVNIYAQADRFSGFAFSFSSWFLQIKIHDAKIHKLKLITKQKMCRSWFQITLQILC